MARSGTSRATPKVPGIAVKERPQAAKVTWSVPGTIPRKRDTKCPRPSVERTGGTSHTRPYVPGIACGRGAEENVYVMDS